MVITDTKIYSLSEAKVKLAEELRELKIAHRFGFPQVSYLRVELLIDAIDPLVWLNNQDQDIKIFWENRERTTVIAAIASAQTYILNSVDEYANFLNNIEKHLPDQFPQMRFFGGFCFNSHYAPQADWKNWNLGKFVLPLIEINQNKERTVLACNLHITKNFKNEIEHACRTLVNLDDSHSDFAGVLNRPYRELKFPDEFTWKATAAHVINAIQSGKYEKLVLARVVRLDFRDALNPFLLMTQLRKTVTNCFSFIFQFDKGECFLATSPERLYRRNKDEILTEALAGTRQRESKDSDDENQQRNLLSSAKDKAEQNYVVDMIRKNLTPLCEHLIADEEPSILKWSAGHHLITRFKGKLKKGILDSTLISHLHPTPAVAGTPAKTVLKDLPFIEKLERGWYCGPVGFISPDESEFAVAIRCGLIRERNLFLYAGAGIIKESMPQAEWEETEGKLSNFFKIFDDSSI